MITQPISTNDNGEPGFWVFGYGSLIWKVDFPYERRVVSYVRSMHRRFWQGSHDHRGTPSQPGRVVTLIGSNEFEAKWRHLDDTIFDAIPKDEKCFGVAYKLRESQVAQVVAHLDHREKNGYSSLTVKVFAADDAFLTTAHVYIGTTDNEAFLGPVGCHELAQQIVVSKGPSGRNIDYFLNLCMAVRIISANHSDSHLSVLEAAVLKVAEGGKACILRIRTQTPFQSWSS
ncbi:ChaC-like protein [Obelidium mucronatum]|nr:ChaC-like protein [Obelidium mucronatum]